MIEQPFFCILVGNPPMEYLLGVVKLVILTLFHQFMDGTDVNLFGKPGEHG